MSLIPSETKNEKKMRKKVSFSDGIAVSSPKGASAHHGYCIAIYVLEVLKTQVALTFSADDGVVMWQRKCLEVSFLDITQLRE